MACPTCKSTTTSGGTPINVEVINNMCGCGCGGSGGSGSGGATGPGAKDPPTWFGGGGHGSGGNNGGPTGGGTGGTGSGTGGDDNSGSGSGGTPSDGDTLHVPPSCLKIASVSHDFCSDGFEFAMANIRSYIEDACEAGGWNRESQKLVSVKLDFEGLCYLTGVSLLGDPLVTTNGRKMTIKDAEGEVHALDFKQDIMQAPLPLTPQFIMRKYDAYGIDVPMGEDGDPIYLDGQMAAPARWLWPCSSPVAARDPAWLYACVASFVTINLDNVYLFAFGPLIANSPYDNAGIGVRCSNSTGFNAYAGLPGGGDSYMNPYNQAMVKACPKIFNSVKVKGFWTHPANAHAIISVYDATAVEYIGSVDTGVMVADTGAFPANMPAFNYTIPLSTPTVVGHMYQVQWTWSAGTFAVTAYSGIFIA